jgi:hypothetical protein
MSAARCDHCGAPLEIEPAVLTVRCRYCQHSHMVSDLRTAVDAPSQQGVGGYVVGQAVLCEWRGRWWPASVLEVNAGLYLIHYDGYSSSWDESVGPERLGPRSATPGAPTTATMHQAGGAGRGAIIAIAGLLVLLSAGLFAVLLSESSSGSNAAPQGSGSPAGTRFTPGQSVRVFWGERYWDATVLHPQPDGTVRVHYNGWADSWDEDVTLDRIQHP